MKILHIITCTKYCPAYQVHREFKRILTRSRRLTHDGIQRMFAKGCAEYDADSSVCVTRVETAIDAR